MSVLLAVAPWYVAMFTVGALAGWVAACRYPAARGRVRAWRTRWQLRHTLAGQIAADGWDAWAASHRLALLDQCPDPGRDGADLTLYEVTTGRWRGTRIVQVIDASPNALGVHTRHGLIVPRTCRTAHAAAAATWGLTPRTYQPTRHT